MSHDMNAEDMQPRLAKPGIILHPRERDCRKVATAELSGDGLGEAG